MKINYGSILSPKPIEDDPKNEKYQKKKKKKQFLIDKTRVCAKEVRDKSGQE